MAVQARVRRGKLAGAITVCVVGLGLLFSQSSLAASLKEALTQLYSQQVELEQSPQSIQLENVGIDHAQVRTKTLSETELKSLAADSDGQINLVNGSFTGSSTGASVLPPTVPSTVLLRFTDQASRRLQSPISSYAKTSSHYRAINQLNTRQLAKATPEVANVMAKNACQMERVFPYAPAHEARQVKAGLHKWYKMTCASQSSNNDLMAELQKSSDVDHVQPKYVYELFEGDLQSPPNDPQYNDQWQYDNQGQTGGTVDADIDLPEAWQITAGDPSIVVAVIDTGVDFNHPDLQHAAWLNLGEDINNDGQLTEADIDGIDNDGNSYIDDFHGWDFRDNDRDAGPDFGNPGDRWDYHGTHVAGTIAAVNNNDIGVAGVAGGNGTNPGVRIMALRGLGEYDSFTYAAHMGARIASNSWGFQSPGYYDEALATAIEYYNNYSFNGLDGLVIFAAGNNGSASSYFPGADPAVMAVAATDHNNDIADFSNTGNYVEIAAPGVGILSTSSSATEPSDYIAINGTSMAAPHVSGVAALVMSEYPFLSGIQVRTILSRSADEIADSTLNGGHLNALQALQLAAQPQSGLYIWEQEKDYGWISVNSSKEETLAIINPSNQAQTASIIFSGDDVFNVTETTITIPARSFYSLNIRFTPLSNQPYEATLQINDGIKEFAVQLTGAGQPFTSQPSIYTTFNVEIGGKDIQPLYLTNCSDYNYDGRMDLMTSGWYNGTDQYASLRFHNGGSTQPSDVSELAINTPFPTRFANSSHLQPADMDGDGDLDIMMSGEVLTDIYNRENASLIRMTRGYRDSNPTSAYGRFGNFTPLSNLSIEGFTAQNIDWYDFDNDGDLDLYLAGAKISTLGSISFNSRQWMVFNNHDGLLRVSDSIESNLDGYSHAATFWLDINNDMNWDFITSGKDYTSNNNGDGTGTIHFSSGAFATTGLSYEFNFANEDEAEYSSALHRVQGASDYDLDGELEFYQADSMMVDDTNNYALSFYEINDYGNYVRYATQATNMSGSFTINHYTLNVDITGNGYYDLLVNLDSDRVGIFENDGLGIFSQVGQIEVGNREFDVCDIDNDGDLDIYFVNGYSVGYIQNDFNMPNSRPQPPVNASHKVVYDDVLFLWDSGDDLETPAEALTYNLKVGDSTGANAIMPGHSRANGERLINQIGNVQYTKKWQLLNLDNGAYTWSIQSIDAGLQGSAFTASSQFVVDKSTNGTADIKLTSSYQFVESTPSNPQFSIEVTLKAENEAGDDITGFAVRVDDDDLKGYKLCGEYDDYYAEHKVWFAENINLAVGSEQTLSLRYCLDNFDIAYLYTTAYSTAEIVAEVIGMDQADPDSTPKNGVTSEDDYRELTLQMPKLRDIEVSIKEVVDSRSDDLEYKIVYEVKRTAGDASLRDVKAMINLPENAVISYTRISPSGSATHNESTGEVLIDTAWPSVTISVYYKDYQLDNDVFHSIEIIEDNGGHDPDSTPGNGIHTEDDYDSVTLAALAGQDFPAELSVSLSATDTRDSDGRLGVRYRIVNNGLTTASNISVQIHQPTGVSYSSTYYGRYDSSTRVWSVGQLNHDRSRFLYLYYDDYQRGSEVSLGMSITEATPSLAEQNNTADDQATKILPAIYDNASLNLDGSINYINHGSHYIRAVIDLTLTNNGPDVLEHALVQTYSDTETYSMPGMQLCNPVDHYDASTKQWQVPDLPVSVGDTRQLRLEFCPTGNDYAALTQDLNFAAEVYSASVASENTIPGNGVQGEADDVELTEGPLYHFFKDIQTLNHSSVAAWADIDGDGDLDLASFDHIGNQNFLFIYQKQGNGRMKPVERYPVGNTRDGILSWGDVDNDGDPDLLATFVSGHNNWRMRLLTNEGSQGGNRFSFAMQTNYGLDQGDAKWHDMDNDGDLDLVVAGHRRVNGVRAIDFQSLLYYHANDNGALATEPLVIVDHYTSSDRLSSGNPVLFDLEIADMNNDGLADVLTSSNQNVTIHYNDLNTTSFLTSKQVLAQQTGIGQLSNGVELAITDCNGDTHPDLVVTRLTSSSSDTNSSSAFRAATKTANSSADNSTQFQALVNLGDGNFTAQDTHAWAADVNDLLVYDFNGDSNADYVFTADNQARMVLGSDNCTVQPQTYFITDSAERLWLAEFEQDHQYDLHITGSPNRQMGPARLLRSLHANTPPSSPSTLTVDYVEGKPVLKWDQGGDPDGSNQLTYNLRIGTQPDANDIINAQSYPAAQQQNRIVPAGNLRSQQYFDLSQLLESGRLDGVDTLYWSVQALDPAGGTSAFATEAAVDMRADLEMSSNVVDNRAENGQVKIQYHVTNTSEVLATDVIVQVETTENLVWRRDNSAPDDRPRFTRTPTGGNWSVERLAPGQTKTLEVVYLYHGHGDVATYGAEVAAMAQNDQDSTPDSGISSTGQEQEDDQTYGELDALQGPDLKLEHMVVADTRVVNEQIISRVTVTNEGDMGVQYVYFDHSVSNMQVLAYDEGDDITQVRNKAEWFVEALPAGASRSVTVTLHNQQGGTVVETGQVTRMLGLDQDSSPSNAAQVAEDDDFSYEYFEVLGSASAAKIQTGSYVRNYCPRMRGKTPVCYNMSYYLVRNAGEQPIQSLDLQVKRSLNQAPAFSYAWGQAFDQRTRAWTITDLAPGRYAFVFMWHIDQTAETDIQQMLVNRGEPVEQVYSIGQIRAAAAKSQLSVPEVDISNSDLLDFQQWSAGDVFTKMSW